MNDAPVWSKSWLRRLSWEDLIKLKKTWMLHLHPLNSLQIARKRRTFEEWDRRKREGGGGWAAK